MATGYRVRFICPAGQWFKATDEYGRMVAHAATAAVKNTGIAARDAARHNIASAGFGPQWQASMVSSMHPKRGDVLNPWAWVHSTINFSGVFEQGVTISGHDWLWIPTAAVPQYPGTGTGKIPPRQMTPSKYREMVGPLKSAGHRGGRAPMLLGLIRGGVSKLPTRKFKGGVRGTRGRLQWAPMFIGISTATIAKRFNTIPAMELAARDLPDFYERALEWKA